MARTR
jgi:hypothetical protein